MLPARPPELDVNAERDRWEVSAVAVHGLSGRPSAGLRREGLGVVSVSEDLVRRWEAAYRRYGEASKASAATSASDPDAARAMVITSQEVAWAWRALESALDMPWWMAAAVGAAAQAFEFQARDWAGRAEGWRGPARRLPIRPRPTPHRRDAGTDER